MTEEFNFNHGLMGTDPFAHFTQCKREFRGQSEKPGQRAFFSNI
jgi:hypothetical protein